MEIERQLRTEGYNLLVKFSRNNRHIEKKSIESFLEQRVDGVIVYSALPQSYNDDWENTDSPMVLITRRTDTEFFGDKIIIDCSMPFHKVMQEMRESGLEKVGMVIEQDLLCEGSFYDIYREYYKNERLIKVVDGSKERGFQAFFELYDACPELDGIIVGSHVIGEGVKKAMQMLRIDIPVYAIKESGWIEDIAVYSGEISVSQKRVAQEAVSRLIDAIEVPQMHEMLSIGLAKREEFCYGS